MKTTLRLTILAAVLTCLALSSTTHATIIISETFGGTSGSNLNGTTAETFSSGITTAGGSSTWVANAAFKADGSGTYDNSSTTSGGISAHLSLGTYINDAMGTNSGKFILETTLAQPVGYNWAAVGFAAESSPSTNSSFNTTGATGYSNMLYRATNDSGTGANSGDIDQYAGANTTNQVAADNELFSGIRKLTITLDFTPDGGYNGATNFGTAYYGADTGIGGVYEEYGSFTYTSALDIRSIILSIYASTLQETSADYNSLTLSQVPEPSTAQLLGALGLLVLLRRR